MCQYTGWCLRHGMKLYRDVGAPDGPFIHFLHATMQMFVGITDEGCRRADLFIHIVGSGLMGAVLAPRFAATRTAAILQRLAWALTASALWLAWYVSQGWGQTVQRDTFYALFGYLGLLLIYTSADFAPRGASVAAFFGGALTMLMVFSRQSGIIFPACALLGVLLADDPVSEQRARRFKAALAGAGAVVVLMLLLLLLFGSLSGMLFWYFRYPLTFHRWLAKQNAFHLLTEWYTAAGLLSVVALVGVLGAAATRAALWVAAFAFPPFLFLIAAVIVGKGWPNHVEQVMAAQVPLVLLVLSRIWSFDAEAAQWRPAHAMAAVIVLLFIAYRADQTLNESPYYSMPQPQPVDHEITEAHELAKYLKAHTTADDTVFFYAHELHIMLDAERRTATPFFQNGLVNTWGFYKGAPAAPDAAPGPKELDAIKRLQDEINAVTCPRLTGPKPPGAFIFLDGAGGIFHNAVAEVIELCPAVEPLLKARYEQANLPQFPLYHVFIRKTP